jgi:hypothetical protein
MTDAAAAVPDGPGVVADVPPGSPVIGPDGGMIMLTGAKLVVPPGALAQPTALALRLANTNFPPIPGNQAPASAVISAEPHGQTFSKPVTLTLTHFGGSMPVGLFTAQPGGTFTRVANAVIGGNTAEAALDHFSYFVVAPLPGDAGAP